jgi:tRNA(Ile2)-agmatinylcytidine synthase
MFGVRARGLATAENATRVLIEAEGTGNICAHRIFVTNQASGDHLQLHMEAIVDNLREMKGGHIEINNSILAFKRGGDINALAQWLKVGDKIQFNGLLFEGMWHLELLRVLESTTKERPLCCGKRMKSMGSEQGLRCSTCKSTMDDTWIQFKRESPIEGWVEPPSDSRRHLARPLDWRA